MEFSKLQDMVRGLIPRRRAESVTAQFGRDARADWQLVFIVFLLINLILFTGNAFVYRQVNDGEIFQLPKREALLLQVLSREELRGAINFFDTKKQRLEELRVKPLNIAGPGPAPIRDK